jgi:hypothetical protein
MEGGGSESFVLGDIGDYKQLNDIAPIVYSSIIGLDFAMMLSRFGGLGGYSLNSYFDNFGLEGLLAGGSYLTILFQIARWSYTSFYMTGERGWSPFVFVCILLILDFLHSMIVYYGILKNIPGGKNDLIDSLKRYAAENGSRALTGHAAFLIFVGVIAMFLKESSSLFTFIIMAIALYSLPFMLTTAGPKPPPPPPTEEKKAAPQWNVPRG